MGGGGSAARSGGLGRALTEVLRAAHVDRGGRATLFGLASAAPGVEERLERALAVLAAAFPTDLVASRYLPADGGEFVRVRSDEPVPPDVAFRLGALFACEGDELLVVPLPSLAADAALAVWRPHGRFSAEERSVVAAVGELAGR